MSNVPNPADLAARFGRRPVVTPSRQKPSPTGWDDAVSLPMAAHFFVDTGIYHSLACSFHVVGMGVLSVIAGHETNANITQEVQSQARETTLRSMVTMLVESMAKSSIAPCPCAMNQSVISSIRDELISDAQLRHPDEPVTSKARAKHGGEAELIHLAELHEDPHARIVCNDAGASAVAKRHAVASIHFLHVLRAAVRAGKISVDEALDASSAGFSESRLAAGELRRTQRRDWLES